MIRFKPIDGEIGRRGVAIFEDRWRGIFNPFLCHFGGGGNTSTTGANGLPTAGSTSNGSGGTTTSTTQNAPWAGVQPSLTAGFNAAGQLLSSPAPQQFYPIASFNDLQNSALTGIGNIASNGTPISSSAPNFANNLESGAYLGANPSSSFFSSLAGGSGLGQDTLNSYAKGNYLNGPNSDGVAQNIMSQVVPQISSVFNKGNSINNPQAARSAAEGVTSALAPIEYQNYQTQEQLQQGAAGVLGQEQNAGATGLSQPFQQTLNNMVQGNALAPQNQALSYADMEKLLGAGTTAQGQQQNILTGASQSANYAQLSPYQQLQAYISAINGGNYGTSSSTTAPYFTNPTANFFGSALGGAQLGSALLSGSDLFGAGAMSSGTAQGVGAGLGALASFFG